MNRKRYIIGIFLVAIFICPTLFAQTFGSPIETRGTGEWTLSAVGTYMNQQVGTETTVSTRALVKSAWGITPWLDFYVMGGGVQVDLEKNDANITDYSDKYRLGYGAGLNLLFKPSRSTKFWIVAGGQVLRFKSEGSFYEDLIVGSEMYTREFAMKYDWREVRANIGIVIPSKKFNLYLGGTGWWLQRMETKREYLDSGSYNSFIGEESGEFRTGLWTGGMVGIEILLPHRYSISIEALFFNESDYHLMVGICQTGQTW